MKEADIAKNPAEIARLKAEKDSLMADVALKASTTARNNLTLMALHKLGLTVDNMPDGPNKQRATSLINDTMLPAVVEGNQARNVEDGSKMALKNVARGFANEDEFQQTMTGLRIGGLNDLAQDYESKHMPGIHGQSSVPLGADARNQIGSGLGFLKQMKMFREWTAKHSGELNWEDREFGQGLAMGLQNAYRAAIDGGVYKAGEQDFIAKAIDPNPTKFFNSIRVDPRLKATELDAAMQLNHRLEALGFQPPKAPVKEDEKKGPDMAKNDKPAKGGKAPTTVERKDANGNTVIYDAKTQKALRFKK